MLFFGAFSAVASSGGRSFAVAFCDQAVGRNAARYEVVYGSLRTRLRKVEVVGIFASAIRVRRKLYRDKWVAAQQLR